MLTINQPEIKETNSGVRLQTVFEIDGTKQILWYEVPETYSKYLTSERADAFVVGLLWYALIGGHDIHVSSPMSAQLHYTLNKHLIPVLVTLRRKYKRIKITCDELATEPIASAGAVGTGLSCGIDSFSTIYDHMENKELDNYDITHFTFFKVGSVQFVTKGESLFNHISSLAKNCSDELGKEFLTVNSNLSDFYGKRSYPATHTLRSMSAVLALQKLFKAYYYSSAVPISGFKLTRKDMAYYDIFTLSMISTESLRLFSTCPTMNRVQKTKLVSNYELSYKYLHVCPYKPNNCGKCIKCLRTLLTLEVVGALDKYKHLFNMNEYYLSRDKYIQNVITLRHKNQFYREIYNEMVRTNFKT